MWKKLLCVSFVVFLIGCNGGGDGGGSENTANIENPSGGSEGEGEKNTPIVEVPTGAVEGKIFYVLSAGAKAKLYCLDENLQLSVVAANLHGDSPVNGTDLYIIYQEEEAGGIIRQKIIDKNFVDIFAGMNLNSVFDGYNWKIGAGEVVFSDKAFNIRELDVMNLQETVLFQEDGIASPIYSPTGQDIYFARRWVDGLQKMAIYSFAVNAPLPNNLGDCVKHWEGNTFWAVTDPKLDAFDNIIIFSDSRKICQLNVDSGVATPLFVANEDPALFRLSPDKKTMVFCDYFKKMYIAERNGDEWVVICSSEGFLFPEIVGVCWKADSSSFVALCRTHDLGVKEYEIALYRVKENAIQRSTLVAENKDIANLRDIDDIFWMP